MSGQTIGKFFFKIYLKLKFKRVANLFVKLKVCFVELTKITISFHIFVTHSHTLDIPTALVVFGIWLQFQ